MGLRPGRCYRKLDPHAYSRTAKKVVRKAFIRGVPQPKIVHFDMGTPKTYKYRVDLIAKESGQIRSNALESTRIIMNRELMKKIGGENFFFQIRAYPHHVLRENALITGAGADRLQTGMRHSFGKPIGTAARIKTGKILMSVKVNTKKDIECVRKAYKKIVPKLSIKTTIEVKELKK